MPFYATDGSAGADLYACLQDPIIVKPHEWTIIPTGIMAEIPSNYEMQIRPRSSLALKYGITLLNSPATIDSDYRGEIKVILINHSSNPYKIENSDRIAQIVISKSVRAEFCEVDDLTDTSRGNGGFGSTGK